MITKTEIDVCFHQSLLSDPPIMSLLPGMNDITRSNRNSAYVLGAISSEVYLMLNERSLEKQALADCLQRALLRLDFFTIREYLAFRGKPCLPLREAESQVKDHYLLGSDDAVIVFAVDDQGDTLFPQRYHGSIEIIVSRILRKTNKSLV